MLCSHIQLPETSYPLFDSLPASIVDTGKLSQLQLEGVLYACAKHQELLPSGHSELTSLSVFRETCLHARGLYRVKGRPLAD